MSELSPNNIDYSRLIANLEEACTHYESVRDFQHRKFQAIRQNDLEALEKFISKEQALVMKSNSLEKKRIELLGTEKNCTFSQLIEKAPVSFRVSLSPLYQRLLDSLQDVKRVNAEIQNLVNSRLQRMQTLIPEAQKTDTYNKEGNKASAVPSSFNKTI